MNAVFDSFQEDSRQLPGVLVMNILWKLFFKSILQKISVGGIVCVQENSFNQTIAYGVDGPHVSYLGTEDCHDPAMNQLAFSTDVNVFVESHAGPETRAYLAVPLNQEFGKYKLRIYPEFGVQYTNRPWIYTCVVAAIMFFTSLLFVGFVCTVERRQHIVMETAITHAHKAAATERELNEFLGT